MSFKKLFILGGVLSLVLLLFSLNQDQSSILIESMESKTTSGKPVFNKISYKKQKGQQIWFMEQSHDGVSAAPERWDKIAIVMEKKEKKLHASFMQFENSQKSISLDHKTKNFKVSCFFCHSNGPRAIRPNYKSNFVSISLWNKMRIGLWNLKIKTYGPISSKGIGSKKPFRHQSAVANKKLEVASCTKCHNSDSWLGRGTLTKQNFLAIRHMVKSDIMPPPGFSISEGDKQELKKFIEF